MSDPVDDTAAREDLLIDTYLKRQGELEAEGRIPTPREDWIAENRDRVERIGAAQLAFVVACVSIFLNFLALNLIFHIEF